MVRDTVILGAVSGTTGWRVFRCCVYVGLCLPRRTLATPEARRPRTWSVASTTNQSDFSSAAFAVHVFCLLICFVSGSLVNHFLQSQAPRPRLPPRLTPISHLHNLSHPPP